MTDTPDPQPKKTGRMQDGTFAPGVSANPAGKPKGARHKTTLAIEAMLEGDHKKLTRKAIDLALAGDTVALRLCLDRLAPPRRDATVKIDLPPVRTAAEAVIAGTVVMEALAAGEATPDEAGRVMAILTAQRGLIETGDLEARIKQLEDRSA